MGIDPTEELKDVRALFQASSDLCGVKDITLVRKSRTGTYIGLSNIQSRLISMNKDDSIEIRNSLKRKIDYVFDVYLKATTKGGESAYKQISVKYVVNKPPKIDKIRNGLI